MHNDANTSFVLNDKRLQRIFRPIITDVVAPRSLAPRPVYCASHLAMMAAKGIIQGWQVMRQFMLQRGRVN